MEPVEAAQQESEAPEVPEVPEVPEAEAMGEDAPAEEAVGEQNVPAEEEEHKDEDQNVVEEGEDQQAEVAHELIDRSAPKAVKKAPVKNVSFKRVDATILANLPAELQDNSFHTKFKFGQGDMFGVEGHNKLKDKCGKGFRKEKSKLKNKNFQGGQLGRITYAVNSTKL